MTMVFFFKIIYSQTINVITSMTLTVLKRDIMKVCKIDGCDNFTDVLRPDTTFYISKSLCILFIYNTNYKKILSYDNVNR